MGRGAAGSGTSSGTRRRKGRLDDSVVALSWMQQMALSGQRASWERLVPRLLAEGGEKVVIPTFAEADMDALLSERVRVFAGDDAELEQGEASQCHSNSARLYRQGRGEIATGYALSKDGYWRQHSWVVAADGHVIETTTLRQRYVGVVLDSAAADSFAAVQLDSED